MFAAKHVNLIDINNLEQWNTVKQIVLVIPFNRDLL